MTTLSSIYFILSTMTVQGNTLQYVGLQQSSNHSANFNPLHSVKQIQGPFIESFTTPSVIL